MKRTIYFSCYYTSWCVTQCSVLSAGEVKMYLLNLSVVEMLVLRKIETLNFKASPHWPSTLIANFESLSPHLHSLLLKGPVLSFPSAQKQRFGVSTFRTCYQLEGWFWFPFCPRPARYSWIYLRTISAFELMGYVVRDALSCWAVLLQPKLL